MTLRPCLTCGKPTSYAARCPPHQRAHERAQRQRRGNDERQTYAWQLRRRQAIDDQPWCQRCGATTNLTLDHLRPMARGGTMHDGVQVLCARCNARRGMAGNITSQTKPLEPRAGLTFLRVAPVQQVEAAG